MPERSSRFFAAAVLSFAWLSPGAADADDFEGTWMHVGDRYGFFAGYIEQVDISGDGNVSVRLFRNREADAGCDDSATGGACDNPQETLRGKLKTNPPARLLLVTEQDELVPAYPSPTYDAIHQQVWQVMGFAGLVPWNYEIEGDVLRLSRVMPAGSGQPELVKAYHRVDPRMPADLYDFLVVMSLSIFKAGCAIDAIQADAGMRAEFRQLIADIAAAGRGGDLAAARDLREWLTANPEANDALFPGAEAALPLIRACLDEIT